MMVIISVQRTGSLSTHFQFDKAPEVTYLPSPITDQNFIACHLQFDNDDDDDCD